MQKGWQEIFILPSFILFIENFYGKLAILSMSPRKCSFVFSIILAFFLVFRTCGLKLVVALTKPF